MGAKRERTKLKIKEAYISLLGNQSPLQITVTDICKLCDINRSTFYEYYPYIDQLISDIIKDQIEKISYVLYDEYYLEKNATEERICKYLQNILNNRVLMRLINCNDENYFRAAITRAQCQYEIDRFNVIDSNKMWQIIYRNSGVLTIIFRWIENGLKPDIHNMSKILYNEIKKSESDK